MLSRAAKKLWYAKWLTPLRLQWDLLCMLREEFQHDRRGFWVLLMHPECRVLRSLTVSVSLSLTAFCALAVVVDGFGTSRVWSNSAVSFVLWWVGLYINSKFVFPDRRTDMLNLDIDELFGGSGRMVIKTAVFLVASQGSYLLLVGVFDWPFLAVKALQWPVFGPASYLVNTFWVYPKVRGKLNFSSLWRKWRKA